MARLDTFLRVAADQNASDLHFHAGKPPMVRYNGDLIALPFRVLSEDETRRFLFEFISDEQQTAIREGKDLDFAYVLEGAARFRVNIYHQTAGLGAVFRIIPEEIPSLYDLRLPGALLDLVHQSRGLVLVTGPTGSGKTTTLAALIQEINRTTRRHIITIEDPIEYVHRPDQCVITQREVGTHAKTFAGALRSALREAPDVLVVGELRDYESINLALTAAEAGVLVLGTLHTNSSAKAIDRILGACPPDVQTQVCGILSVLIKGVVAQRLCKLASGEGRIAAIELMLPSHSISHMIREQKVHQIDAYLRSSASLAGGARSLDASLHELVLAGLVAEEEARRVSSDPETFDRFLAASTM